MKFRELKRSMVYGRWRRPRSVDTQRYSIVLACPMDMPFLLKLALEVLGHVELRQCREILVVPDGSLNDSGQSLKTVIQHADDPRLRYVEPGLRWRLLMPHVHNHPAMIALATEASTCKFAFVHDLDAFMHDADTVENLFGEFRERGMVAMGITPRWDESFNKMDLTIPGTWELFFDTQWLQSYPRQMVFGRTQITPAGDTAFDSMLYPQYLEAYSGRVGVSHNPPSIVHFNGTVRTFRNYQLRGQHQVTDQLFRLALLSAIETVLRDRRETRITPEPHILHRGLNEAAHADVPVRYDSTINNRGYPEFRYMLDQMCETPVFRGARAREIRSIFNPFDQHFGYQPGYRGTPALSTGEVRTSGL